MPQERRQGSPRICGIDELDVARKADPLRDSQAVLGTNDVGCLLPWKCRFQVHSIMSSA